ncbi:HAE1 family hydrophobic/amphiphilic exporter-1 [Thermosporothrix hazakensis]|jgi:HAE1 family hydrophobic/amphiphilic exporter-1|uniref:HAE1 family hydrophobic/amphiphilic exporter-1 n=1 Tax=Thermosporothrix hazakensis TaxID=644383 RepID=A0A326U147_THEHA|nr:efflux RND transporter permease subunit [Thermosporothrix hazakensis]PZW24244.1 HAE1 family hydrophobic/amphiphilic exporter-1 [Thermosporothrix hazakensis]GCE47875.1 hydrogenase expression protein [Thermosporothrix hazakensis]
MSVFSRLSLANRGLVALATIAILLVGGFLIPQLKQELFPSLDFPAITIVSTYVGASPEIVEKDVTEPIERTLKGAPGITSLTSTSSESVSVVTANYDFGTDLSQARQQLNDRINQIQSQLPEDVKPSLQSFNISDLPVMYLSVSSSQDSQQLALDLKQKVVPELQSIPDVARVEITGIREQIVTITLDMKKLAATGISQEQIQGALQANNLTLPAGSLDASGKSLPVRVGNTFTSINDIKNIIVGVRAAQMPPTTGIPGQESIPGMTGTQMQTAPIPVKLSDVATVKQELEPSTSITHTNGKPSIGISITKSNAGNTVAISHAVQDRLSDLEKKLGNNAHFTVTSDQTPYIEQSIEGLVREGLIGAGFAILVILVFLFSIRSTLVTAVSIPLSVVVALIGLWAGNYTLNMLTLGGLTIAIGRVVDDSIVVLENIYRHLHRGANKQQAVLDGVREVAGAITASTLTTVAVFLPLGFVNGMVGVLFRPFALTVTIALLASLVVALTIIPVLAYWFLKAPSAKQAAKAEAAHEKPTFLEKGYTPLIAWVTKHRIITILAAIVILVGSLFSATFLKINFFDMGDQHTFMVQQEFPSGTDLNKASQEVKQVEDILARTKGIKNYQATISSGSNSMGFLTGGGGGVSASIVVTTETSATTKDVQQDVQNQVKKLNNAEKITVSESSMSASTNTIKVLVQSSDNKTLEKAAQQVLDTVSKTKNLKNVKSDLAASAPLIDVHVDPQKASMYGLTPAQVGQYLRAIYTGTSVTKVTLNNTQQDVYLKLGTPAKSLNELKNTILPTKTGQAVKLSDVATVAQQNGPAQLRHDGGSRTATISADVAGDNLAAVNSELSESLKKLDLPAGTTYSIGGVTQQQNESFRNMGIAMLVAVLIVYLIMVATFHSLVQPLVLLVSIPFAATGSLLLMLATDTTLDITSLIGMLMLIGIVVTNAIVLIDRVNQYRAQGMSAQEAVIKGGTERLRPILMTAIATILALVPMALGLSSEGVVLSRPLAIVVIGGLTTSTILTLLIVPTLYVMVEGVKDRLNRKPAVAVAHANGAKPREPEKTGPLH